MTLFDFGVRHPDFARATTKGAVHVLAKFITRELGARGISVKVVAPGASGPGLGRHVPVKP